MAVIEIFNSFSRLLHFLSKVRGADDAAFVASTLFYSLHILARYCVVLACHSCRGITTQLCEEVALIFLTYLLKLMPALLDLLGPSEHLLTVWGSYCAEFCRMEHGRWRARRNVIDRSAFSCLEAIIGFDSILVI